MDSRRVITFNTEFENQLKNHLDSRKAYEAAEEKFKTAVGYTHYSGFESFQSARNRKLRSRKK